MLAQMRMALQSMNQMIMLEQFKLMEDTLVNMVNMKLLLPQTGKSKQYKFVEKDMSDYFDLITQKMDDKLNGAKFKKKLDTIKEEYSIESKKVENKN